MSKEFKTTKWVLLFAAVVLCQLNADNSRCLPIDKNHPMCICDEQGKNCDGYCEGKVVRQMPLEDMYKAMGWKK